MLKGVVRVGRILGQRRPPAKTPLFTFGKLVLRGAESASYQRVGTIAG
jgi:hypothetical protein